MRYRSHHGIVISLSGPETILCFFLRKIGIVNKVIFWSTDFVPHNRFSSRWKNVIYHFVNKYCVEHADYAWNLSPRIAVGRSKILGWSDDLSQKQKVVPMGISLPKKGLIPLSEEGRFTLVFLGHILEKQGIQLVIESIPDIISVIPNFKFIIIGTGPYENELKKMVVLKKLSNYVIFKGFVKSNEKVEELLSNCACAVAPYSIDLDTWTYWADPGKLKTYLSLSLPIILTNVSYNSLEIEQAKCGIIISYIKEDLIYAIKKLLCDRDLLIEYRKNAYNYSKQFDWEIIFEKALHDIYF